MRRLVFLVFVSSLLLSIAFVQRGTSPTVKAAVHQGDLILTGSNVTTIEGLFNINGSIIVTENATLVLINAVVNFTQTIGWQFNMIFENPVNGNPRLLAYNSTITSVHDFGVRLRDNSTAIVNHSTVSRFGFLADDYSTLTVLNSSFIPHLSGLGFSNITVYNSTMGEWYNHDSPRVEVYDSKISIIIISPTSVNCTISNLRAGNFSFWNFLTNCPVTVLPGGSCPNVTLTNTTVDLWSFAFYGSSDAVITDSAICEASSTDSSVIHLIRSSVDFVLPQSFASFWAYDSLIYYLNPANSANWLFNTTYNILNIALFARVYVYWYLDIHVADAIGQDVPSANVSVSYSNMTIADSKLTDDNGWVRFALMEKMINTTAQYPFGNYTVEATYLTHSNSTTANMTGNKQIELTEDFVIPEFSYFLMLPLFMIATLLAVIIHRRKHIDTR